MTLQFPRIPILGYSDRLSVRPGEQVAFMVHSESAGPFTVRLTRSICADPNPAGMGIVEEPVDFDFGPGFPSRRQAFNPGSYGIVPRSPPVSGQVTLSVTIWPTRPYAQEQVILSAGGVEIFITADSRLAARIGDAVLIGGPILERHWYDIALTWYPATGTATLTQTGRDIWTEATEASGVLPGTWDASAPVLFAATLRDSHADLHFNGKIQAPTILDGGSVAAAWDFAQGTMTTQVTDTGAHGLHGQLINFPARAMKGADWVGTEMRWRDAPQQYGAIHFHDDDIYDFGWETDFIWTVPEDLPTGIYIVRLTCGEHEDAIPVFVCPPKGQRHNDLAVLISTFTYTVYGNHERPDFNPAWLETIKNWNAYPWNAAEYPELGTSTYNHHSDGSGICHASARRPLLTIRPGYITYGYGTHSGLRHFQADSHLIAWLHDQGIGYDIITDQELHDEGVEVLKGYRCVTTGSHPEYHTPETLDALQQYRDGGGNFCYLGGNGFYWRVALHLQEPSMIEIRRSEGGIRAWAAEPGEYFNAFDGGYGGLWRRNGRPPQLLGGVGFSAQGQFEGSYYRRTQDSYADDLAWIFEGVDDEVIGDFGFSGYGAAGFELDRVDVRLGSPETVRILAQSEGHGGSFVLVHEEQLTHLTTVPLEPPEKLMRADMVYFEVPGGGQVFSTGSITFCGSLPWNGCENNVSRIMRNVFERFLG
ncbi:MAG: N,N-dimethylformamidase beta subunit family domain-containing protein [Pseudomonadota bacterium]